MEAYLVRAVGRAALIALAVLLFPFAAMRYTREVNWGVEDFLAAWLLIFVAGLSCSILLRQIQGTVRRIAALGLVLAVAAAVWVHLAAGLFS